MSDPSRPDTTTEDDVAVVRKKGQAALASFAADRYGKKVRASWWGWLLRKRQPDWSSHGVPGDDHVEYWERDGSRFRISHPYGLGWHDLRELVRFCEANGLRVSIDARSWYYHGATLLVVMQKDEVPL